MDRNATIVGITEEGSMSHSARGAWIETGQAPIGAYCTVSHSARGAWIETHCYLSEPPKGIVALREGCVDRNLTPPLKLVSFMCRTPRGVRG